MWVRREEVARGAHGLVLWDAQDAIEEREIVLRLVDRLLRLQGRRPPHTRAGRGVRTARQLIEPGERPLRGAEHL